MIIIPGSSANSTNFGDKHRTIFNRFKTVITPNEYVNGRQCMYTFIMLSTHYEICILCCTGVISVEKLTIGCQGG